MGAIIASVKKGDEPFFIKTDFVADTNDVCWYVYKRLKNGSEKLVKVFKTRRGAINGCYSKNLGHFQNQGYTSFRLIEKVGEQ